MFPKFPHFSEPFSLAVFVNTAAKTGEDYKPARSDSGKGEKLQVLGRCFMFPLQQVRTIRSWWFSGEGNDMNDCQLSCVIFMHFVIMLA